MQRTVDIEDLLGWTYRAQLADVVIERGYGLHPIEREADGIQVFRASADGVVGCMRSGALGTSAIGGMSSIKDDLHPDAERVHSTTMMLGGIDAMLVVRHAKAATRPDWLPNARHRFEPVWKVGRKFADDTGLPVKGSYQVITDWDKSRHVRSTYCPISEHDGRDHVAAKREVYRRWRRALVVLADYFVAAPLSAHIVRGPAAAATPWDAGVTGLCSW